MPIFDEDHMNMSFHGNRMEDIGLVAKSVPLAFQMKQNGTFLENFEYDHKILHKKLVLDEIYLIFIKWLISL